MDVGAVLGREALVRRWRELGADPASPDYYELDEYGELIKSARPTNDHQRVCTAVAMALAGRLGPEAAQEISVVTDRGVRVPDIVWMPQARWGTAKGQTPLPFDPDICVDVLSTGNTREEIGMKVAAYLRGGAREVIAIGLTGTIEYFGPEGKRAQSALGVSFGLPPDLF